MSQQLLSYKGYHGTVEVSLKDGILFGKVIGVNSLISYEGHDVTELKKDFQGAIDDYLTLCKENGEEPEKTYTGSFNVRLTPEMHKNLALYAEAHHESLNNTVKEAVKEYLTSDK